MVDHSNDQKPVDIKMVPAANDTPEPNPDFDGTSDNFDDNDEDDSVDTESVPASHHSLEQKNRQDSPGPLGINHYPIFGKVPRLPSQREVPFWENHDGHTAGSHFERDKMDWNSLPNDAIRQLDPITLDPTLYMEPPNLPQVRVDVSIPEPQWDPREHTPSYDHFSLVHVYIMGAAVLGGLLYALCRCYVCSDCVESKSYYAHVARARASNTRRTRNDVPHTSITPTPTPTRPPIASNEDFVAVNITPDRVEFNSRPFRPSLAAKDDLPPSYITCLLEEDHPPSYSTWMLGDTGDSCGLPESPGVHGDTGLLRPAGAPSEARAEASLST